MHNIAYSININGRFLLEISKGHTKEISKFIFHLLDTIWYFKKCKVPENPWQPAIWMGFSNPTQDGCDDILR